MGVTGSFTLTLQVLLIAELEWSLTVIVMPSALGFKPRTIPPITETMSGASDSQSIQRSVASSGVNTNLVVRSSSCPKSISYSAGSISNLTSVVVLASTTFIVHVDFFSGSDLSETVTVAVPTLTPFTICVSLSKASTSFVSSTTHSTSIREALSGLVKTLSL